MASANTGVYEFDGMVRGLNVYKTVWTPLTLMKRCKCIMQEDNNEHNEYTVDDWLQLSQIEDTLLTTYQERYWEYADFY